MPSKVAVELSHPCMQHRHKLKSGAAWWIRGFCLEVCKASRLGVGALTALQQSQGLAELEGLHAVLADSLAQLRVAFGNVLATRYREATMYLDLRDLKLESPELVGVMMGA